MKKSVVFMAVLMVAVAVPSMAAVLAVDLGSGGTGGARPTSPVTFPAPVGPLSWVLVDRTPQAAIANYTIVSSVSIPPFGTLSWSPSTDKRHTPGGGWATWSGGYNGPCFYQGTGSATETFTLPSGAMQGFSIYVEANSFSTYNFEVCASPGPTCLTLPITGLSGARGWAFGTDTGALTTVTIRDTTGGSALGYAFAEFGGQGEAPPEPGDCPCEPEFETTWDAIDSIEAKADAMEGKLDALEGKSDAMEGKLDAIETKLDSIECDVDTCSIVIAMADLLDIDLPTTHPCYVEPPPGPDLHGIRTR